MSEPSFEGPPLNAEGSAPEIVRRDTVPVRAPLDHESPAFLGDEDTPFERHTSLGLGRWTAS